MIGGENPIAVQTMWDRPIDDVSAVLRDIEELYMLGCDLIRFSVLDQDALSPLSILCKESPIPIIADIHFDYTLAVRAIESGAAKVRINPGNIGADWKVQEIIQAARDHGAAIRIGINGGSLPVAYRSRENRAESMIEVINRYLDLFDKRDFDQLVVSLKDSDTETCYRVNRAFAEISDIPLHLGVTEAGPLIPAVTKSAFVLGRLLNEGIGDTIRISITGKISDEVVAAKELLKAVKRYHKGVDIISCPKCGRAEFDTHAFMKEIEYELQKIEEPITIAVMGCAVNGPGEAGRADLGITGLGRDVVIFKYGKIIQHVAPQDAKTTFLNELKAVIDEKYHN